MWVVWYHTRQRQESYNYGEENICYSRGSYWCLSWNIFHTHNIKISFHVDHIRILGSIECGKTRNDFLRDNSSKIYIKLKEDYAEKWKKTGIEIQGQHWGGNR